MDFTNILEGLPVVIIGLTAVLIYFGKIISEAQVAKYDRIDTLISGLFFALGLLVFPLSLNVLFYQKGWILDAPLWVSILFNLVVIGISWLYLASKNRKKLELEKELHWLVRFFENKLVLFLLSTGIFYLIMTTINHATTINNADVLPLTTVVVLSFFNLTMIAIAYGDSTAYYPQIKITFVDGETIEGKNLKIGEFICILSKGQLVYINKDHVKIISEDLMRKKDSNQGA